MRLYLCQLTFHENLFYATREVGRLYETGRYLHNYALTYALGLATAPYFQRQQAPSYAEEISPLNDRGIYVTPARGLSVHYELVTFKFANNAYHVQMEKSSQNVPSFGRAKEVAAGSQFEFAVISRDAIRLPRWIRMGIWRSKALVECVGEISLQRSSTGEREASLPLNPLDTPGEFRIYDVISMPPSSLVEKARIYTDWLTGKVEEREIHIPAGMYYRFPEMN